MKTKNGDGFIQAPAFQKKSGAGFTLIELLVVISIIGLLASVVLVALNSARSKARDAKRLADLKQLNTAVELYYSTNNAYPDAPGMGELPTGGHFMDFSYNLMTNVLISASIIAKAPQDPSFAPNPTDPTQSYHYDHFCTSYGTATSTATTQFYRMWASSENPNVQPNAFPAGWGNKVIGFGNCPVF